MCKHIVLYYRFQASAMWPGAGLDACCGKNGVTAGNQSGHLQVTVFSSAYIITVCKTSTRGSYCSFAGVQDRLIRTENPFLPQNLSLSPGVEQFTWTMPGVATAPPAPRPRRSGFEDFWAELRFRRCQSVQNVSKAAICATCRHTAARL